MAFRSRAEVSGVTAEVRGIPVSTQLEAFVSEAPVAREPHVTFLAGVAARLARGASVLDVGAGDAPYRELFSQQKYLTSDWAGTEHTGNTADIVASAEAIPVADGSFDCIVSTQMLEHVPEPWRVLEEFHRVIAPGGLVAVTAPLTWFLHEEPHDYYRFTAYGLRYLLERAGFVDVDVQPMNDSPATVAELLRQLRWIVAAGEDDASQARGAAGEVIARLGEVVESYSYLDTQLKLPISFAATGRRP